MVKRLIYVALVVVMVSSVQAQDGGETPVRIGGPTSSMIHDFGDAGGPLFALLDAGVLRSESGGASWEAIDFPYAWSREIAVGSDGTLVVTTPSGLAVRRSGTWSIVRAGDYYSPILTDDGAIVVIEAVTGAGSDSLLRSTDNGATWRALPARSIEMAEVVTTDDGALWLLGEGGIERSDDDGASWSMHGETPVGAGVRGMVTRRGTIFIITSTDVYRSYSSDTTWVDAGDAPVDRDIIDIEVAPSGDIYVAYDTADGNPTSSLYHTSDSGTIWAPMPVPTYGGRKVAVRAITFGGIGGFEGNVILGTSFTDSEAIDPDRSVAQIFYHTGAVVPLLAFTTSPSTSYILRVDRGPNGTLYATRYPQTLPFEEEDVLLASRDSGVSWERIRPENAEARSSTLTILENGTALVAAGDSGLYRSTNAARTWERVATPAGAWIPLGDVIELEDGTLLLESRVFFNRTTIYTSTDDGVTWTEGSPREDIRGAIATAASPDGTVYIAENNTIFSSTDRGASWTNRSVASGGNYLVGMTIDGDGNPVAASFNGPLYGSTDKGQTWVELEDSPGASLFAITSDGTGRLFVADRRNRIFRSDDKGATWTIHATLPGPRMATRTLAAGNDGNLYIGTEERGIWFASLAGGRVSVEGQRYWPEGVDLQ